LKKNKTLILIRHAEALDRAQARKSRIPDADRALTAKGKKVFSRHMNQRSELIAGAQVFVCSPYLRALQTLEIIQKKIKKSGSVPVTILDFITPDDDIKKFTRWFRCQTAEKTVLIGHEPFISNLIGFYLKSDPLNFKIRKSAVVVLQERTVAQMQIAGLYAPE